MFFQVFVFTGHLFCADNFSSAGYLSTLTMNTTATSAATTATNFLFLFLAADAVNYLEILYLGFCRMFLHNQVLLKRAHSL